MTAMQDEDLLQGELPLETFELDGRPYFVAIVPCMSVREVAAYCRVSTKTIYNAAEAGMLPAGRARTGKSDDAGNARLVFRQVDVDAWLFGEAAPGERMPRPAARRTTKPAPDLPIPVDPRARKRRMTVVEP